MQSIVTYLEQFVSQFCQLDNHQQKIYLAFSGGLDSTVLLHALSNTSCKPSLEAIHINHHLNSSSSRWQQHCQQQCEKLSILLHVKQVQITNNNKLGIEANARKARYAAFESLLNNLNSNSRILFTAHHQNDQAETMLLNLLRGSGISGLRAMQFKSKLSSITLLRPLLAFSRQQLTDYAIEHQLSWIEDDSNMDLQFSRNFLRHEIFGRLLTRWPKAVEQFSRSATHCLEAEQLLADLAQLDLLSCQTDQPNIIVTNQIKQLSANRQKNLLKYWLSQLGFVLPNYKKINNLLEDCINSRYDAAPVVSWPGCEIRRFRNKLYAIKSSNVNSKNIDLVYNYNPQQILSIKSLNLTITSQKILGEGVDISKLNNKNIIIKFRQGGEKINLDCGGHKSVKKIFQQLNIPPWQRDKLPFVYVDGNLAAIVGAGVDVKYAVNQEQWGLQFYVE